MISLLFPVVKLQSNLLIDPLLLVQAEEVWSVIGKQNSVWQGWDATNTPLLIYFPNRQEVLINHPNPPTGFIRYAGPLKCPIGSLYVRTGKTTFDLDGQNTSTELNGVQTLVVADTLSRRRQWVEGLAPAIGANPNKADETVAGSLFPNPYDSMQVIAHEAFHVYQHKMAPKKGAYELALLEYPTLSVENNVGVALEGDSIKAALSSSTPAEARGHALEWLAIRDWRRKYLPESGAKYEDGVEFSEGTAKYIEYRLLGALEGRKPGKEMWLVQGFHGYDLSSERKDLIDQMEAVLSGKSVINNDLYGASPVRFRLYYSAMGIGAMLDRLSIPWQHRILSTDASLTEIARSQLNPTSSELESALRHVQSTSRFQSLMTEKTELAKNGETYVRSVVSTFDSAPGELVLDWSPSAKARARYTFTPFGILRVGDKRTVYRLIPIRGMIGSLSFSEDGPRPVLDDEQAKSTRFQLAAAPDPQAIQKQLNLAGLDNQQFEAKELQLPGVILKNVKGSITVNGRKVTIRLNSDRP